MNPCQQASNGRSTTAREFTAVPACIAIYMQKAFGAGEKRVARLVRQSQLRCVCGYKLPCCRAGMPSTTAPHRILQREFTVVLPDPVWVTDITYIRTCIVPESGDLIVRPDANDLAVLGVLAALDGVPRRKRQQSQRSKFSPVRRLLAKGRLTCLKQSKSLSPDSGDSLAKKGLEAMIGF